MNKAKLRHRKHAKPRKKKKKKREQEQEKESLDGSVSLQIIKKLGPN